MYATFYWAYRYRMNGTFLQEQARASGSSAAAWGAWGSICNMYDELTCTLAFGTKEARLTPIGIQITKVSTGASNTFYWAP